MHTFCAKIGSYYGHVSVEQERKSLIIMMNSGGILMIKKSTPELS